MTVLLVAAAGGYLLPLLMPTFKALGVYVLVAFALLGLVLLNATEPRGLSDQLVVYGIGLAAVLSSFAGVLTRLVTLALKDQKSSLGLRLAVHAVLPSIAAALILWPMWRDRPPSEACRAAQFAFEVAGRSYLLPASGMIEVEAAAEPGRIWDLGRDADLGRFCRSFVREGRTIPVTGLSLSFRTIGTRPSRGRDPVCSGYRPEWSEVCGRDRGAAAGYPERAGVFRSEGSVRYGHFAAGTPAAITRRMRDANARAVTTEGDYTVHGGRLWVANTERDAAGAPLMMSCERADTRLDRHRCVALSSRPGGVTLGVIFQAPYAGIAEARREAERRVEDLLAKLAAPATGIASLPPSR